MAKLTRTNSNLSRMAHHVTRLKSICRVEWLTGSARICLGRTRRQQFKPTTNTSLSFMLLSTGILQRNGLAAKFSARRRNTKNIQKSLGSTTSLTKRAVRIEIARLAAPKPVPHQRVRLRRQALKTRRRIAVIRTITAKSRAKARSQVSQPRSRARLKAKRSRRKANAPLARRARTSLGIEFLRSLTRRALSRP